jgi:glycosyltransferase involved in cell wall biosynthesis
MAELVSVIVPTFNSAKTLNRCLDSIAAQDYPAVELIVVDNNSRDATVEIAKSYTPHVYVHGHERSSQRNFGAAMAKGKYLLFVDSDMVLEADVLKQCVNTLIQDNTLASLVIPEKSFGTNFWAKCKALEKRFYEGVNWIEAPRFFSRQAFDSVTGYDEALVSGEDWELGQRIRKKFRQGRIKAYVLHNEGKPSFLSLVKKKGYYAGKSGDYRKKLKLNPLTAFSLVCRRYLLFLSKPLLTLSDPAHYTGMIVLKTAEFGYGLLRLK